MHQREIENMERKRLMKFHKLDQLLFFDQLQAQICFRIDQIQKSIFLFLYRIYTDVYYLINY